MLNKNKPLIITIFDTCIDILAFVAGAILVAMWGVVCTEVILRFLFGYSIIWAVEVTEFCLLLVTFVGAAWLLKKEGHIKVDIVYVLLSAKSQAYTNIVTSLMGALVCYYLLRYGMVVTIEHFRDGAVSFTTMRFPTWPRYAVISVGSGLLLIQFLRRAYSNVKLLKSGREASAIHETEKVNSEIELE